MHDNDFLNVLTNMPHLRRWFLGRFQCYRYYMPTAFKKDFMPLAFNPDGVFAHHFHACSPFHLSAFPQIIMSIMINKSNHSLIMSIILISVHSPSTLLPLSVLFRSDLVRTSFGCFPKKLRTRSVQGPNKRRIRVYRVRNETITRTLKNKKATLVRVQGGFIINFYLAVRSIS